MQQHELHLARPVWTGVYFGMGLIVAPVALVAIAWCSVFAMTLAAGGMAWFFADKPEPAIVRMADVEEEFPVEQPASPDGVDAFTDPEATEEVPSPVDLPSETTTAVEPTQEVPEEAPWNIPWVGILLGLIACSVVLGTGGFLYWEYQQG